MDIESFIYLNENSLSKEICNDIINLYEKEESRYPGVTGSGYKPNIKNALDFIIPMNDVWGKIRNLLVEELNRNLKKYLSNLKDNFNITIKRFKNFFLLLLL